MFLIITFIIIIKIINESDVAKLIYTLPFERVFPITYFFVTNFFVVDTVGIV